MNLLFEVLGAFAAACAVRFVAGAISWRAALATVAAILGIATIVNYGWSQARGILHARKPDKAARAVDRRASVGARFGANESFLAAADSKIPRKATVFLICPNCSVELGQWITYRLTPRIFADRVAPGQWILTYDARPEQGKVRRSDLTDVTTVAPRFVIGRLR